MTLIVIIYFAAWAMGLAWSLSYIRKIKTEAPAIGAHIFRKEPKIKNDWRFFIFIMRGKFDQIPNQNLRRESALFRFYIIGFFVLLIALAATMFLQKKNTEPNQSLQTMTTAVTCRAAHAPRQLWSCLI